jgi:branched-chain amino acid transport system substrate-binding protein
MCLSFAFFATSLRSLRLKRTYSTIPFLIKAFVQLCLLLTLLTCSVNQKVFSQDQSFGKGPIKIGLLVQDSIHKASLHGARLAVNIANRKGGLNGRPFQLIVRSMEGPWGTGSKQAVNLIFEEEVWALVGSHDGRNAHLVEQAATKSQVVFVSAWSGDPTLSQAFVPWFYNCIPNDQQQAAAIVREIFTNRKMSKVAIVSDNEYDSKQALSNFLKKTRLDGNPDPVNFLFEKYGNDINSLANQLRKAGFGCVILFCSPSNSLRLFRGFKRLKIDLPVFGSLQLLNEDLLSETELSEYNDYLLVPSLDWSFDENPSFISEYTKSYGIRPGMVAAFAFDAMNTLIKAVIEAGSPDRDKIQKALSGINYAGVTGRIRFDDKGNRTGNLYLRKVIKGVPNAGRKD